MSLRHSAILAVGAVFISACGQKSATPPPPPVEVGVVTAHAQPVPLTRELVGRLSATRSADVRARVSGVLLKRQYNEGSLVKAGQPLFQIDPAPLRATLSGAEAALAQAQANATNAHVAAERNRELLTKGLVSRASVDDAEANERSTAAQVLQAKASLEMARINLSYATVTAPISGRSGQQRVTEGALVGQGEATLLTVVEQIDPIYVNFDQPAGDVERLRRLQSTGDVTLVDGNSAQVQVLLQDGSPYKHLGTLDFLDYSVNPTTGALAFRGIVPNPERELLPGMYVNIRLTLGQLNHAFLVPQAAMQRDNDGPFVKVVGADGKVAQKRVVSDAVNGSNWIVTSGIAQGDQIIVQGVQMARPGAPVKVVPAAAPGSAPSNAGSSGTSSASAASSAAPGGSASGSAGSAKQ